MMRPWWTTSCFLTAMLQLHGKHQCVRILENYYSLSRRGKYSVGLSAFCVFQRVVYPPSLSAAVPIITALCCQGKTLFSPGIIEPDIMFWNKLLALSASDLQLQRQKRLHRVFPFFTHLNKGERALLTVASERRHQPCARPRPARNEFGPPVMMLSPSCRRGGVKTSPASHLLAPLLVPDDGNEAPQVKGSAGFSMNPE